MTTTIKAYTLIEILIVIGIIALLASMAIPNLMKSRNTSNTQVCISNLININNAIQQWALETRPSENAPITFTDIRPYLSGRIVCPSGGKTFGDSYSITTINDKPTCKRSPSTHRMPEDNTQ
jgi:prepilin-type N-terminal cleavage/methylation domain-containing protein